MQSKIKLKTSLTAVQIRLTAPFFPSASQREKDEIKQRPAHSDLHNVSQSAQSQLPLKPPTSVNFTLFAQTLLN